MSLDDTMAELGIPTHPTATKPTGPTVDRDVPRWTDPDRTPTDPNVHHSGGPVDLPGLSRAMFGTSFSSSPFTFKAFDPDPDDGWTQLAPGVMWSPTPNPWSIVIDPDRLRPESAFPPRNPNHSYRFMPRIADWDDWARFVRREARTVRRRLSDRWADFAYDSSVLDLFDTLGSFPKPWRKPEPLCRCVTCWGDRPGRFDDA